MGVRPNVEEQSPVRGILPDILHVKSLDRHSVWDRFPLKRLHSFFGKDALSQSPSQCPTVPQRPQPQSTPPPQREGSSRPIDVGLPRQATFRRQNSERRDRLLPVQPCLAERRAASVSSCRSLSTGPRRSKSSPPPMHIARVSAPAVAKYDQPQSPADRPHVPLIVDEEISPIGLDPEVQDEYSRPARPPSRTSSDDSTRDRFPELDERAMLSAELDTKWILNLSMHFRDKSDREKFFVTYAEKPNRWRRVTVSCDYRNAEPGSLEMDLKELKFQRDKSLQIYGSIRDSLLDIQFYDTVTNLKLETSDGRLHVHVTEDTNEIIPYPPKTMIAHILEDLDFRPLEVRESELIFDCHLSGFVYKVTHAGKSYIKKEIPGPDTVDEFLYEINALHALHGSKHVIQLEAIVLDDSSQVVKGLLISFAERGAVVDLLYDHKGDIPWEDRVRWAQQVVQGLSEIHEEGYIQGDFTLSNIVVDSDNNAQIIDINRRGCPVGWEPPEIAKKIASNQRISMYIGEKSDLYQLGMSLWALAMDDDEPERHDPPLSTDEFPMEVPEWYQDIVRICLSPEPRDRLSAKELLRLFEASCSTSVGLFGEPRSAFAMQRSRKYIDPAAAVERDDLEKFNRAPIPDETLVDTPASSFDDWTYTFPRSSNYDFGSTSSEIDRPRGRRLSKNTTHLQPSPYRPASPADHPSTGQVEEEFEPQIVSIEPGGGALYDEVKFNGHHFLVSKANEDGLGLSMDSGYSWNDGGSLAAPSTTNVLAQAVTDPKDEWLASPPVGPEDIDLDLPDSTVNDISATTDSTPKTSQAVLDNYAIPNSTSLALDTSNKDLAGFGSSPELHQYSPHEPKASSPQEQVRPAIQSSENTAIDEPASGHRVPPPMPLADSGYDEPFIGGCSEDVSISTQDHDNALTPSRASSAHVKTIPGRNAEHPRTAATIQDVPEKELSEDLPPLPPSPEHAIGLAITTDEPTPVQLSAG